MGRRGPAPRPTNLRILHGERPGRINTSEPVPGDELPVCPPEVSDEVRSIWDFTVSHLATMGTAVAADRDTLLAFCEAVATHRKASALLAKSPSLIQGHRGVLVRNPAIAIQRDAAAVIRAFAHEFGLTPSARSEIRTGRPGGGRLHAERLLS